MHDRFFKLISHIHIHSHIFIIFMDEICSVVILPCFVHFWSNGRWFSVDNFTRNTKTAHVETACRTEHQKPNM